jgi:3-oxoacyl-[acyl-carrier-protein] synthase III
MKVAAIRAIEYHLPENVLSTAELAREFPEWSIEKIEEKTGIHQRHIAAPGECSSDLGVAAARKLFDSGVCAPSEIDYILFCTQSPDYFLPTTACLMQQELGIPTTAGALDYNLGCSGFIYGLGMARGLIETDQAKNVLLITAETYSKFINRRDKSVRTLFGDAAAATLVSATDAEQPLIGPFVFGTDGAGGKNLIVPTGGMRAERTVDSAIETQDESGNWRSGDDLFMNGAEIFNFTLRTIPKCVNDLFERSGTAASDIQFFLFHQANRYMLDHLRKRMKLPEEKFLMRMSDCGNTVSSTIPIVLRHAICDERIKSGDLLMLVGFGVGYSWGACLVRWP